MDVDTTNMTALPALKAVTATDQGGILAIAASMALVFAILSLLIRAYVRIECSAAFAKDDLVSCLSMAVTVIQTSVVFVAIARGYGRISSDLTVEATYDWQRDIYVADILYLIGMWLTKCSIALLLMRLSRDPAHTRISHILLVASTVYFVISIFVVAIRCDLSEPWAIGGTRTCAASTFARWSAVTALDVVTEVALFLGSMQLVRGLQLPWSKKSVVVFAYGLRVPLIAIAGIRLHYLHKAIYSDDQSLHGILASVCTQVELGFAVAAVTMPCLKPFMSALNTQYGGGPACIVVNHSVVTAQRSRDYSGNGSTATPLSMSRKSTESETRFFENKATVGVDVSLHPLPQMPPAAGTLSREEEDKLDRHDDRSASLSSSTSAQRFDAENFGEAV